jgi:Protein of unknown function (DUF664)
MSGSPLSLPERAVHSHITGASLPRGRGLCLRCVIPLRPGKLGYISQGHALLHVMEEVCQHLGQLEITRDLLRQR